MRGVRRDGADEEKLSIVDLEACPLGRVVTTKVFVSHSAKNEADGRVLKRIVAKLKAENFEPWVDYERLKTGNPWHAGITQALQDCDAAVILFSKAALASDFVKYEVSVLDHRKRSQPSFGLFPVIIDRTALERFDKDFYGAIRIKDFQFGRLKEKEKEVFDRLRKLDPVLDVPSSDIEGALMQVFRNVAPEVLRRAAGELKWPTWAHVPVADAEALSFVRQLLSASLADQIKALKKIVKDLPPDRDFAYVFGRIAPWWVDERAAHELSGVQRGTPGQRCALLNGTHGDWTCGMFLQRARPSEEASLIPATIPVGRRAASDLLAQIRSSLCARYGTSKDQQVTEIDAALNAKMDDRERLLGAFDTYVVHLDEPRLPAIKGVLDAFRHLTLVVMTGQSMPRVPAALAGKVTRIMPELVHDEEIERHSEAYAYKIVNLLGE